MPLTVRYPSSIAPAVPGLALDAPDGWEPAVVPGALLAVVGPAGGEGERPNVIVRWSRLSPDHTLDAAATAVDRATHDLPEIEVIGSETGDIDGRPTVVHEIAFRHDSGRTVVQCHVLFLVQHGPVTDVVHVVGSVDGPSAGDEIAAIRAVATSVRTGDGA